MHTPRPPPVAADGISIGPLYPHGRRAEDWYVLTVAVDFLSFIYIALFYQVRSLPSAVVPIPCAAPLVPSACSITNDAASE